MSMNRDHIAIIDHEDHHTNQEQRQDKSFSKFKQRFNEIYHILKILLCEAVEKPPFSKKIICRFATKKLLVSSIHHQPAAFV